jgi:hypothetical protein
MVSSMSTAAPASGVPSGRVASTNFVTRGGVNVDGAAGVGAVSCACARAAGAAAVSSASALATNLHFFRVRGISSSAAVVQRKPCQRAAPGDSVVFLVVASAAGSDATAVRPDNVTSVRLVARAPVNRQIGCGTPDAERRDSRSNHPTKELAMQSRTIVSLFSMFLGASALASSAARADEPAQVVNSDEPQTVIGDRSNRPTTISGWFVAPTVATTGFGGAIAYAPGIRGGIYLNRRLALGIAANGLGQDASSLGRHEVRNVGGYGGLLVEYVLRSNRLVHATLESTIGTGQWYVYAGDTGGQNVVDGKRFLAFEPAANLELNVAPHVRLATGVGYRFAIAGAGAGPSSAEMSSLVVRTALVLGSF